MNLELPSLSDEDILNNDEHRWRKFCLDSRIWERQSSTIQELRFTWNNVPFRRDCQDQIPEEQGVYMFVIEPNVKLHVQHSYILYIGRARNLRERFKQYFSYRNSRHPSDQLRRVMVLVWEKYLLFSYCLASDLELSELDDLEYALIDTIVPPMNSQFRAEVIKQRVKLYAPR